MLSCLQVVANSLLTVTQEVHHYQAMDKQDKYCVWAEDGESGNLDADNVKAEQTITGTIDYFTRDDDDTAPDAFQQAFNAAGFGWSLNSVQYEDDTRYIHYEWLFRVRNTVDGQSDVQGT